jgi:hypothetical protein
VHLAATESTVEIWNVAERLAVHPRAARPGQRRGLPHADDGRRREPLARQHGAFEIEVRSLIA